MRFVISSLPRRLLGLLIALTVCAAIVATADLELGVGAIVWVPGVIVLIPALGLLRRWVLLLGDGEVTIETGSLFRHRRIIPLEQAALEIVPTAGLRAVVLHLGKRELVLATWLRPRRAHQLADLLDAAAGSTLPRRERAANPLDR